MNLITFRPRPAAAVVFLALPAEIIPLRPYSAPATYTAMAEARWREAIECRRKHDRAGYDSRMVDVARLDRQAELARQHQEAVESARRTRRETISAVDWILEKARGSK